VGSDTVPTITGADSEIDPILRKVSEAIYSKTQPYRFAQYVYSANGFKEGEIVQKSLIANGSAKDRFWAYNGLITMYAAQLDFERADKAARSAIALRPESALPYFNLGRSELVARHDEAALVASEAASRHQRDPDIDEQTWASVRPWIECLASSLHGDFGRAIERCRQAEFSPDVANNRMQARLLQMPAFAAVHDAAALRDAYADLPPTDDPPSLAARAGYEALNEVSLGHGSLLLDNRALFQRNLTKLPYSFFFNPRSFQPAVAYALALSGDFSGARAEIDKTPADCSVCLRMRGRIDALQKNWNGADYWFSRAARNAPSTPFPFTDWGRMLLDKGDTDAAIIKFKLANRRGPHFADPLEGWGEALMARNRSDLALAKFEEANKYAPNWGRLHLKWGEALVYAGHKDEARAQFARAGQLDLTPSDKRELANNHV
jgi:tetratricopeptide (TPR) repeat protein